MNARRWILVLAPSLALVMVGAAASLGGHPARPAVCNPYCAPKPSTPVLDTSSFSCDDLQLAIPGRIDQVRQNHLFSETYAEQAARVDRDVKLSELRRAWFQKGCAR